MGRAATAVYLAVIGDLVRSREEADRAGLQRRLGKVLRETNQEFAEAIASAFVVTIGDEFQGLLRTSRHLAELLGKIRAGLHPSEIRYGIGMGRLETKLRKKAVGMDGPCFHHARAALVRAKKSATPVEVDSEEAAAVFRVYSELYGALRRRWTARQRLVADLAMAGLPGRGIAQRLGIAPSAVSQHLRAADKNAVVAATGLWEAALAEAFQHCGEQRGCK